MTVPDASSPCEQNEISPWTSFVPVTLSDSASDQYLSHSPRRGNAPISMHRCVNAALDLEGVSNLQNLYISNRALDASINPSSPPQMCDQSRTLDPQTLQSNSPSTELSPSSINSPSILRNDLAYAEPSRQGQWSAENYANISGSPNYGSTTASPGRSKQDAEDRRNLCPGRIQAHQLQTDSHFPGWPTVKQEPSVDTVAEEGSMRSFESVRSTGLKDEPHSAECDSSPNTSGDMVDNLHGYSFFEDAHWPLDPTETTIHPIDDDDWLMDLQQDAAEGTDEDTDAAAIRQSGLPILQQGETSKSILRCKRSRQRRSPRTSPPFPQEMDFPPSGEEDFMSDTAASSPRLNHDGNGANDDTGSESDNNYISSRSSSSEEGSDAVVGKSITKRQRAQQRHTNTRRTTSKDRFLVECKSRGMSYKEIKRIGKFEEAESTLRGRYRSLTKAKDQRVRKPEWRRRDIKLLFKAVPKCTETLKTSSTRSEVTKTSWKRVADYIKDNGGSYHFGNATCKKKWLEVHNQATESSKGSRATGTDDDLDRMNFQVYCRRHF